MAPELDMERRWWRARQDAHSSYVPGRPATKARGGELGGELGAVRATLSSGELKGKEAESYLQVATAMATCKWRALSGDLLVARNEISQV